jgi:hypothetical protein
MEGWGRVGEATREQLAQDVVRYTTGLESGAALVWQSAMLLGYPPPQATIA